MLRGLKNCQGNFDLIINQIFQIVKKKVKQLCVRISYRFLTPQKIRYHLQKEYLLTEKDVQHDNMLTYTLGERGSGFCYGAIMAPLSFFKCQKKHKRRAT